MKKIIFVFIALVYATTVFAKNPVPTTVQNSFIDKYPHASQINWNAEENGFYEVDFTIKDHRYLVLMDKNGAIVNAGEKINWLELPVDARHLLANEFQGFYMETLLKETKNSSTHFITKFIHNNYHYVAVFETDGQTILLHREQKTK